MVDWRSLDVPTRVGLVATVVAVVLLIVPPLSVASALVAIVFCAVGARRARSAAESNRTASRCLAISSVLVVVVVAGNVLYALGNP